MKSRFPFLALSLLPAFGAPLFAGDLFYDFADKPVFLSSPANIDFSGGEAAVVGDLAQLNDNIPYSSGSMRVGNLDPGRAVKAFAVAFNMVVGPGGGADGWALVFAGPGAGFFGQSAPVEEADAPKGGLALQYKVRAEGETGYFRIRVGASSFSMPVPSEDLEDNSPLPVTFKWTKEGGALATLTTADGKIHRVAASADALARAGLAIKQGYVFTFSGRSGERANWHRVGRLSITTAPAP